MLLGAVVEERERARVHGVLIEIAADGGRKIVAGLGLLAEKNLAGKGGCAVKTERVMRQAV